LLQTASGGFRIAAMKNSYARFCLGICLLALAGCSAEASLAGKYHIEQDGYGFGPGAEKITLDLNADKTFAVQAGPKVTMLKGTWEAKEKQVTFSEGSGNLVVNYRAEAGKLIPMKDGKDVPGWRWAP
jgi:hypothetical protein